MRQNIYILKKIQWCWSDGNRWKRTKQNIYSIVSLEGNTQKNDVCWDIYNLTTQFWHFEISLIWVSNFDNMYSEMEIQRKQTRSGETEETQFHFLIVLPDAAKKERKYYSDWNPYFLNKTEHSLYCENWCRKRWIEYPEYFPLWAHIPGSFPDSSTLACPPSAHNPNTFCLCPHVFVF